MFNAMQTTGVLRGASQAGGNQVVSGVTPVGAVILRILRIAAAVAGLWL